MNETQEAVEASTQNAPEISALVLVIAVVFSVLWGMWLGRLANRPKSLQKSVLRKALDRHLTVLRDRPEDTEEYRVASQLRHGRLLREKYDD